MTRIWTGTASVVQGYTTVTVVSGDPLSDINCPADASISLDGRLMHVSERVDTTTFEMTSAWEWSDGTYLLEIDPLNPNAISLVTLSQAIATYDARLALLDANGRGLYLKSKGFTGANDPGPGYVGRNAAAFADSDEWYFDILDQNGQSVADILALFKIGDILVARSIDTNAYARIQITTLPTDNTGWYTVEHEYLSGSGTITDEELLAVEWNRVGDGLEYDVQVANILERAAYDGETAGFRVLVSDVGDGRAALYTLLTTGSPTEWSPPAYLTPADGEDGEDGDDGAAATIAVGTVTTLDPGEQATVVNSGTSAAAVFDFGIPAGEGLDYNVIVADLAARAAYDGETAGFRVAVQDTGDGRAAVYELAETGSPTVWLGPLYITGAPGEDGEDGDAGGVTDGDKGDVVVSGSGTVWTVENQVKTVNIQVFTSSGMYTPTAGMKYAIIECVGGGGGGGGVDGTVGHGIGAGGGGGGGYARKRCTAADIGASQTVTVGAGGSAGASTPGNGGAGGDTSVGTLCIGKGGSGGALANSSTPGAGGAGGVAGTGDLTFPGGDGDNGDGALLTTVYPMSGNGGNSYFGSGARGNLQTATGATAGAAGRNYGGGGSGGVEFNQSNNAAGGAGAAGVVIITEFI